MWLKFDFLSGKSYKELILFLRFFWYGLFLVFIESVTILLLFYVWFFGFWACGILAPLPGIEPTSLSLGGEVLTNELPGTSPNSLFLKEFNVVQSLSHVWLFATPWTTALQASLSFIISWSFFKLMSIESVIPFNHLILCCPLLLLPSIFPNIRVFSWC